MYLPQNKVDMVRLPRILSLFWVYGLSLQTAYVDVCDDTRYALLAKSFNDKAAAANISAITTGGIYPGVSNGAMTNSYNCFFSWFTVHALCYMLAFGPVN